MAIGILMDFAITYETINSIIMIPNPSPTLDDSSENAEPLPISAERAPASTPRPTLNQNNLSSPPFIFDSSVWLGNPTGLSFVSSLTSGFSSPFFFGCLAN